MNDEPVEHPLFDTRDAWLAADAMPMFPAAQKRLGTVGAGNRYVDLFREVKEGVEEAGSPM
ncbi:hypothetical protein [Roseococcus sp.]|uniref:hypothetical protein n=1 Tax=Roseococcus sp. TaxID=2109646 RepID=UPI003BADB35A